MSDTVTIDEAINKLDQVTNQIKASDFTGLLEENDEGYREKAIENIKKAQESLAAIYNAEKRQATK